MMTISTLVSGDDCSFGYHIGEVCVRFRIESNDESVSLKCRLRSGEEIGAQIVQIDRVSAVKSMSGLEPKRTVSYLQWMALTLTMGKAGSQRGHVAFDE